MRKYRPDLGVVLSDRPATVAAVYTLNECQAAPIAYCKSILPSDSIVALLTNSGQANAATGAEGAERNLKMVSALAQVLDCEPRQIAVASTGVIGQHLDLDKIVPALPELVNRALDHAEAMATAILTTDLVPKTVSTEVRLTGGTVRITGIAKGSGMIHPNMATMLGYLLTDAKLEIAEAEPLLKRAVDVSFNMISVDGDTSTNDCVFLMSNGASAVKLENDGDRARFQAALGEIAVVLAQSIARDGEGATKLIEVSLKNAPDLAIARKAARGLTVSPLLKSAIHGSDPNWGRVLARLGAEGVPAALLAKMDLRLQETWVYRDGAPIPFDRAQAHAQLKRDTVRIEIDLKAGEHHVSAWGCDLTRKYVDINTEYS